MVQIVSELLEFSRSRYTPMDEPVAIEQVIEEAIINTCGRADAPEVEITRNFAPDLPKVRAANLYQVFCNLIKNALDSMPEGGTLEITTTVERSGQIVIELRDSGCGFDPANAEAIFEPFFTTKTQGRGTGLGLAICKDLMARYGGHVSAKNHPDRGSIFTVYLPKQGENKK
jgi:signal transduction histidine kinase